MVGFGKTAEKLKNGGGRMFLVIALLIALVLMLSSFGRESGGEPTELEARMERVLSKIDGAGEVNVLLTEKDGKTQGALIVAEGAGDLSVRLAVRQAVSTLLGIENERIDVRKMEGRAYEKIR